MDKFNKSVKELKKRSKSYSSQGKDVAEAAMALLRESQGGKICCMASQTCRVDESDDGASASDDPSLDEITIIQGKSECKRTLARLNATIDRFSEDIPAMGGVPLTTPRILPLPLRTTTTEDMYKAGFPIPGCGIPSGSLLYKKILLPSELEISLQKQRRRDARKKKKRLDAQRAALEEQLMIDMVVKYVDAGVCGGPCRTDEDTCVNEPEEFAETDDACIGGCVDDEDEEDLIVEVEDACIGDCVDDEGEAAYLVQEEVECIGTCVDGEDEAPVLEQEEVECMGTCVDYEEEEPIELEDECTGDCLDGQDEGPIIVQEEVVGLQPVQQVKPVEDGVCVESCTEGGPGCG